MAQERIVQVAREARGSRTRAAQLLGISRHGFWMKVKAFGIDMGAIIKW